MHVDADQHPDQYANNYINANPDILMTLATSAYRNDYNGNGTLATYSFTFPLTATSQLVFLETTAGVTTTKLLTTDYTATQNADITTGGSVTRVAGNLPSGTQLTILRIVPLVQNYSFKNQQTFYPSDYESAIDYIMEVLDQLQDQVNRCLQYPQAEVVGTAVAVLPAVSLRASKTLKFDASGNAITS